MLAESGIVSAPPSHWWAPQNSDSQPLWNCGILAPPASAFSTWDWLKITSQTSQETRLIEAHLSCKHGPLPSAVIHHLSSRLQHCACDKLGSRHIAHHQDSKHTKVPLAPHLILFPTPSPHTSSHTCSRSLSSIRSNGPRRQGSRWQCRQHCSSHHLQCGACRSPRHHESLPGLLLLFGTKSDIY